MITKERRQLLNTLAEFGVRYPHWRFGQLISNVAGWGDGDFATISDFQLQAEARAHLTRRFGSTANGALAHLSATRESLFSHLESLCDLQTDQSLGQIVSMVQGLAATGIYDVEDDQLIAAAVAHLQSRGAKEEAATKIFT